MSVNGIKYINKKTFFRVGTPYGKTTRLPYESDFVEGPYTICEVYQEPKKVKASDYFGRLEPGSWLGVDGRIVFESDEALHKHDEAVGNKAVTEFIKNTPLYHKDIIERADAAGDFSDVPRILRKIYPYWYLNGAKKHKKHNRCPCCREREE